MPDISMCSNKNCKSRLECYRYRAYPSKFMQSYIVVEGETDKDKCRYFWRLDGELRVRCKSELKRLEIQKGNVSGNDETFN